MMRTIVLVDAARLAFDLALPTEAAGTSVLPLPDREERWVRRLFERAVGGFHDVVLSPAGWRVATGRTLYWQIEWSTPGIDRILPNMRTDVVLDHPPSGRRIVVDRKFNSMLASGWHRDQALRSGYLYQIYAYLRSQGRPRGSPCGSGRRAAPASVGGEERRRDRRRPEASDPVRHGRFDRFDFGDPRSVA